MDPHIFDSIGANPRKAVFEDEYKKKLEEYQEAKYRKRPTDWRLFLHARFPEFNWLRPRGLFVKQEIF